MLPQSKSEQIQEMQDYGLRNPSGNDRLSSQIEAQLFSKIKEQLLDLLKLANPTFGYVNHITPVEPIHKDLNTLFAKIKALRFEGLNAAYLVSEESYQATYYVDLNKIDGRVRNFYGTWNEFVSSPNTNAKCNFTYRLKCLILLFDMHILLPDLIHSVFAADEMYLENLCKALSNLARYCIREMDWGEIDSISKVTTEEIKFLFEHEPHAEKYSLILGWMKRYINQDIDCKELYEIDLNAFNVLLQTHVRNDFPELNVFSSDDLSQLARDLFDVIMKSPKSDTKKQNDAPDYLLKAGIGVSKQALDTLIDLHYEFENLFEQILENAYKETSLPDRYTTVYEIFTRSHSEEHLPAYEQYLTSNGEELTTSALSTKELTHLAHLVTRATQHVVLKTAAFASKIYEDLQSKLNAIYQKGLDLNLFLALFGQERGEILSRYLEPEFKTERFYVFYFNTNYFSNLFNPPEKKYLCAALNWMIQNNLLNNANVHHIIRNSDLSKLLDKINFTIDTEIEIKQTVFDSAIKMRHVKLERFARIRHDLSRKCEEKSLSQSILENNDGKITALESKITNQILGSMTRRGKKSFELFFASGLRETSAASSDIHIIPHK